MTVPRGTGGRFAPAAPDGPEESRDTAPETDRSEGGAPGRSKWSKKRAKAFLDSCPKRSVFIQRTQDEEAHEVRTGQPLHRYIGWNGWSYTVPVGRSIEVPEPIAQIIDQSQELLRTTQAKERRAFFNSLNDGELGVEITI